MTDSDRRHLSFSQAQGLAPLPSPLALNEISGEARALIWAVLYADLAANKQQDRETNYEIHAGLFWRMVMRRWFVEVDHKPTDEFKTDFNTIRVNVKHKALNWHLPYLFDFLTFVMRASNRPQSLVDGLRDAFIKSRLAYRISENTIYPTASAEEAATIERALVDVRQSEYNGARKHLLEAGGLLTTGEWAGSVRESIHAVESVARSIEPKATTLSDALKKLASAGSMNPNLKRGLEALYAYSSDEKGIRHALVFSEEPNVSQEDAVFMFGACASFVSFLISRAAKQTLDA
jgi:hypothetical protein